MANTNAPFGLKPIKVLGGGCPKPSGDYSIASTYGSSIFRGMPVEMTGTGTNVQQAAAGNVDNIGVFYGDDALSLRAIKEIFDAFMNQPRSLTNHRGNILNPVWTHVGIGIAHNPAGSLVATQNFISAPAARIRGR